MDTRDNFTRTSLRIPQELYDRLVEAAAGKNSLNAEIISRLESSLDESVLSAKVADASFTRGIQIGLVEAILIEDDPIAALHALRERLRRPLLDLKKLDRSLDEGPDDWPHDPELGADVEPPDDGMNLDQADEVDASEPGAPSARSSLTILPKRLTPSRADQAFDPSAEKQKATRRPRKEPK